MADTRDYLNEIRAGLEKLKAKGSVTETEKALFDMIDGLAGMLHRTNERVTELERLHGGKSAATTTTRA